MAISIFCHNSETFVWWFHDQETNHKKSTILRMRTITFRWNCLFVIWEWPADEIAWELKCIRNCNWHGNKYKYAIYCSMLFFFIRISFYIHLSLQNQRYINSKQRFFHSKRTYKEGSGDLYRNLPVIKVDNKKLDGHESWKNDILENIGLGQVLNGRSWVKVNGEWGENGRSFCSQFRPSEIFRPSTFTFKNF